MAKLMEIIFNEILAEQSKEQLGAEPYERTEERTAYRNGTRERELNTRVGTLNLRVPRHRNGNFSTALFKRYQRSEQSASSGHDANGHRWRLNQKDREYHGRTLWKKFFQVDGIGFMQKTGSGCRAIPSSAIGKILSFSPI